MSELRSVVFPAPEAPIMATTSPGLTQPNAEFKIILGELFSFFGLEIVPKPLVKSFLTGEDSFFCFAWIVMFSHEKVMGGFKSISVDPFFFVGGLDFLRSVSFSPLSPSLAILSGRATNCNRRREGRLSHHMIHKHRCQIHARDAREVDYTCTDYECDY